MYPIRFEPIYQTYVWGGNRIAKEFNRNIDLPIIAESWELCDRPDQMSLVANGIYKGKSLNELVFTLGEKLLGTDQHTDRFPLLLKIIDAKENLSIQVHPDEFCAPRLKGEPKTEMWTCLDNCSVLSNLKKGVTQEQFLQAIHAGTAERLLDRLELKKGDTVYIPAGRVHAICSGSLLFEVQQNSNTTYRLYDWARKGRELHLKEGFEAIHWQDLGHAKVAPQHVSSDLSHQLVTLVSSPFFTVERLDVFNHFHLGAIPNSFQIFFFTEGVGSILVNGHKEPFGPGLTYLVPAACKSIEIQGKCQAIRIRN